MIVINIKDQELIAAIIHMMDLVTMKKEIIIQMVIKLLKEKEVVWN